MEGKGRGLVLLVVGVVLLLVSVGADSIGVGAHPGLGWKQMLGGAVGAVMAVIGLLGLRTKRA